MSPYEPQVEIPERYGMVGDSPQMERVFDRIDRLADGGSTVPVLILGENGTGKDVVARTIHLRSPRASGPFVPVNCGGIPDNLIESEFFGHEKGSFTGAHERRVGHFEASAGGTLFLDEIGNMPLAVQMGLLRALENHEITRVGGSTPIPVDIRVVTATNADLDQAVEEGTFRMDLLYRLNVVTLRLPALRERAGDVVHLLNYFLSMTEALDAPPEIDPQALSMLQRFSWPGNVRELSNFVEGWAATTTPDDLTQIGPDDLPDTMKSARRSRARQKARGEPILEAEEVREVLTRLQAPEAVRGRERRHIHNAVLREFREPFARASRSRYSSRLVCRELMKHLSGPACVDAVVHDDYLRMYLFDLMLKEQRKEGGSATLTKEIGGLVRADLREIDYDRHFLELLEEASDLAVQASLTPQRPERNDRARNLWLLIDALSESGTELTDHFAGAPALTHRSPSGDLDDIQSRVASLLCKHQLMAPARLEEWLLEDWREHVARPESWFDEDSEYYQRFAAAARRRDLEGLGLLREINDAAGQTGALAGSWRKAWEEELDALEEFVDIHFEDDPNHRDPGQKGSIVQYVVSRSRSASRLYVVGPAGSGKTTLLLEAWRELVAIGRRIENAAHAGRHAEPLLLSARELNPLQADANIISDPLEAAVRQWLEDRGLLTEEALESMVHGLLKGTILLLVDGLDESVGAAWRDGDLRWLRVLPSVVIASRPERLPATRGLSYVQVTLVESWPLPRLRTYLHRRTKRDGGDAAAQSMLDALEELHDLPPWTRNPRTVALLLELHRREERAGGLLHWGDFLRGKGLAELFHLMIEYEAQRCQLSAAQLLKDLLPLSIEHLFETGEMRLELVAGDERPRWLDATGVVRIVEGRTGVVSVRMENTSLADYVFATRIFDDLSGAVPSGDPGTPQAYSLGPWSNNQLGLLGELMVQQEGLDPGQIMDHLELYRARARSLPSPGFYRESDDYTPEACPDRFGATNLLHALKIVASTDGEALRLYDEDFRSLFLHGVRLDGVELSGCTFHGAYLAGSDFTGATLDRCDMTRANLQEAQLVDASLTDCSFDFHVVAHECQHTRGASAEVRPCAVDRTVIEGTRFAARGGNGSYQADLIDHFRSHGAAVHMSRYLGTFARAFQDHRDLLYGAGYAAADEAYLSSVFREIETAIERHKDRRIQIVDLMAGSDPFLAKILDDFGERVRIAAIDRDLRHLRVQGDELRPVSSELKSGADLRREVTAAFAGEARVDLVIGRKAIHEVRRRVQIELLEQCAGLLVPGAKLILFADSPDSMSDEGGRSWKATQKSSDCAMRATCR